ncbi:MAG: Na+/proline symporter [Bacillariaceae sp.]|jgi:Na+/proline symporter
MDLLIGAALWGWWVQRKRIQESKVMESAEEELASKFIAGRSLGPFITSMIMLASSFSGFTVVGIPQEAFLRGWTSLKWVTLQVPIMIMWSGAGLRLRKASLVRNHQSPIDIITIVSVLKSFDTIS